MKIKKKLTLSFLLIYLVTICSTSAFFYSRAHIHLTEQILNHLESVVSIQKTRVENFIEQDKERLSLVSSRTQLRLSLAEYLKTGSPDDQRRMNSILADARSAISHFEDISILDPGGTVAASTNERMIGTNLRSEEFFVRGLKGNNVGLLFLDENNAVKNYMSGPLSLRDRLLGVLVIKADTGYLTELVTDYSGLGNTGETLLAKKGDGKAVFLMPLRFDRNAALKRTVPSEALDIPIIQALLKNESLFEKAIDYRGIPVLSATRYIGMTGWGLVAKIDRAEALRPITLLQYTLALIIVISSTVVAGISLYLARTITAPLNRLTKAAGKIEKGNLSSRADITSDDEIGTLVQTFNRMSASLENTTSELKQKIIQLKKSEEELKLKVKQLEEFYEMAVSREIKMKKLKEKIYNLEKERIGLKARQEI